MRRARNTRKMNATCITMINAPLTLSLSPEGSTIDARRPSCGFVAGRFGGLAEQRCIGRSLGHRLRRHNNSVRAALGVAKALVDSAALDDCHLAAHEIGQAAWLLHAASTNHLSLTMLAATARHVLSMCSSVCLSGCIHAVLAQALAAALRMSDLARVADSPLQTANFLAFLSDLCSADSISHYLAPTYGRPLTAVEVEREGWDCAHGIGHGFGSGVVRSRLLEIETAWRLCLDAGNRVCVGAGLMMEMVDARVEAAEASAAMAASDHGGMSGSDDGGGGEASIARYGVCESLLVGSWQATCFEGTCHPTCYYNLGEAIMFAACHDRAYVR